MSRTTLVGIVDGEIRDNGELVVDGWSGHTIDNTLDKEAHMLAQAEAYETMGQVLLKQAEFIRLMLSGPEGLAQAAAEAKSLLAEVEAEEAKDFWDQYTLDDILSGVDDILNE